MLSQVTIKRISRKKAILFVGPNHNSYGVVRIFPVQFKNWVLHETSTHTHNMANHFHENKYTPEDSHRTWKWWFGFRWFSVTRGRIVFSGEPAVNLPGCFFFSLLGFRAKQISLEALSAQLSARFANRFTTSRGGFWVWRWQSDLFGWIYQCVCFSSRLVKNMLKFRFILLGSDIYQYLKPFNINWLYIYISIYMLVKIQL